MNALYIVTAYVHLDDGLKAQHFQDDVRAQVTTAEVLTVAVVAARFFQNHHERALCLLQMVGAIPRLSVSRFNRRLHQAQSALLALLDQVRLARAPSGLYLIDTLPLPMCRRVRAERCTKVQGRGYLGRCAAKREWFYGWRLHWVCDLSGFPIAFDLLPAVWHELTPLHYLLADLPPASRVLGDGAYVSQAEEALALAAGAIHLIPKRHARLARQNSPEERWLLRRFRLTIETAHSRLEKMGIQRLFARTLTGFGVKVLASLLALAFDHLLPTSN
jgi:hypothetical protein